VPDNYINVSILKIAMKAGRPVGSPVRQNVIEILFLLGSGYGYEVSSIYQQVFPKVTRRLIYYHLKKGVEIGEIKVAKVKKEKGDYTWGSIAEKTYYALGENARPKLNEKVKTYLDSRKK